MLKENEILARNRAFIYFGIGKIQGKASDREGTPRTIESYAPMGKYQYEKLYLRLAVLVLVCRTGISSTV